MLLKWLGIGVAIGTLVLTACVLVISLTDDPGRPATKTTSLVRMVVPHPAPPPATTTAAVTTDPNESSGADFELPDDPQPGAARTPTKRTAKAKPRLAVRDVPF